MARKNKVICTRNEYLAYFVICRAWKAYLLRRAVEAKIRRRETIKRHLEFAKIKGPKVSELEQILGKDLTTIGFEDSYLSDVDSK